MYGIFFEQPNNFALNKRSYYIRYQFLCKIQKIEIKFRIFVISFYCKLTFELTLFELSFYQK